MKYLKTIIAIFVIALVAGAFYFILGAGNNNLTGFVVGENLINVSREQALDSLAKSEQIIEKMIEMELPFVFMNDTLLKAKKTFEQVEYATILKGEINASATERSEAQKALRLLDWEDITYDSVIIYTNQIKEREDRIFTLYDSLIAIQISLGGEGDLEAYAALEESFKKITRETCAGEKCDLPAQLFDISFSLDDWEIQNTSELFAVVIFENFGTEATPANLTFTILDQDESEVYRENISIVVETEKVVIWEYEGLRELPEAKYTAILETLYDVDVRDKFTQRFEITKEEGEGLLEKKVSVLGSGTDLDEETKELFEQVTRAFYEDREDTEELLVELKEHIEAKNLESATSNVLKSNFMKRNWWWVLILFMTAGAVSYMVYKNVASRKLKEKIAKMKLEKQTILELMKKLQQERFKENNISDLVYKIRMKKYKDRLTTIKRMLPVVEASYKSSKLKKFGRKQLEKTPKGVPREKEFLYKGQKNIAVKNKK
jgi:hypothetical protein